MTNEIDGWSGRIYFSKTVFGQQRKKKEKQSMMKRRVVIPDKHSQEKVKQVPSLSNHSESELYSHHPCQLPSTLPTSTSR